jgi:hypothetical protein
VPAAAVIPAPIAYIKAVAVKTLVVESLLSIMGYLLEYIPVFAITILIMQEVRLLYIRNCYFEKIRVFQAGVML